jgi:hypothetical protein
MVFFNMMNGQRREGRRKIDEVGGKRKDSCEKEQMVLKGKDNSHAIFMLWTMGKNYCG